MSKYYHTRNLFRYLGFIFLFSLLNVCGAFDKGNDNICIKIASKNISLEELKKDIEFICSEMEISAIEKAPLKEQLIKQCIDHYLMMVYAEEEGISIENQELDHALKGLKQDYTEQEFKEALLKGYIDQDMWNQRFRERLLKNKIIRKMAESMPQPTYEEIKQYYDNHQDMFRSAYMLKFRQIVTLTREKAEDVLDLLNQGEKMSALAEKYSIAPEGQNGGEVGWVSEKQLDESMSNALFSLPEKKLSKIVETSYGFHIFKVLEIRPAGNVPLADAIDEIKSTLVSQRLDGYVKKQLDHLRNRFQVVVYNEILDTMEL